MAFQHLILVYSLLPSIRFVLVFTCVLLLVKSFLDRHTYRNLPPGPWGLPLIGANFRLGANPGQTMLEMSKKYGKIFSIRIGLRLTVVINDSDLVKEAYGNKAVATSARDLYTLDWMDVSGSLVACSGSDVKPLRRFLLRSLRDFGLGKKNSEILIMEEAQHLCRRLDKENGKSFDPRNLIQMAVANIICILCFGMRYRYTSAQMNHLITGLQAVSHIPGIGLTREIPMLFLAPRFKTFREGGLVFRKMMEDILQKHIESFDPDHPRDVVDKLIREVSSDDCPFSFGNDRIYRTMMDMFGASVDTTASVLQFAVWYMAAYPNIQKRVQSEILEKVGTGRAPNMADRPRLPFTYATVNEILRLTHPVPLSLIHRSTEPFELAGYSIPKGADLMSPIWSLNHDPDNWENPDKFDPERFLSDDGEMVNLPDKFLPFGTGSRKCIGEGLARYELFLFFATMMQRFTFDLPPEAEAHKSCQARFGYFLWYPTQYRIQATPNI